MKKVITCTGYGYTGSSVITDFLKEFDCCRPLGETEYTIMHEPNGISDLEYRLVENNNRYSVDYGVLKFKALVERLSGTKSRPGIYEKTFKHKFRKISEDYISKLVQVSFLGNWEIDYIEASLKKKILHRILDKFRRMYLDILRIDYGEKPPFFDSMLYERKMCYSYFDKDEFYKTTERYLEALFSEIDDIDQYEYLVFDQLVPSANISRYFNYYRAMKVIVVDRDPRDIFILNREKWKANWIPNDLDTYIKWFRSIREHLKHESEDANQVLRIRFEDFVYKYDETSKRIMSFLELTNEHHTKQKQYFNPDLSIKNTRTWNTYTAYIGDLNTIKMELPEFCYDYN